MNKEQMIERVNELLQNVEPMKFALETSNNEEEIASLREEIKAQYVEINNLREELNLFRGM